jgi:hypothetical protein
MTIFSSVERKHWTPFHKIHQNIILKVGDAFCFYHILYSLTGFDGHKYSFYWPRYAVAKLIRICDGQIPNLRRQLFRYDTVIPLI